MQNRTGGGRRDRGSRRNRIGNRSIVLLPQLPRVTVIIIITIIIIIIINIITLHGE